MVLVLNVSHTTANLVDTIQAKIQANLSPPGLELSASVHDVEESVVQLHMSRPPATLLPLQLMVTLDVVPRTSETTSWLRYQSWARPNFYRRVLMNGSLEQFHEAQE